MASVPNFSANQIEQISRILGDISSGSKITSTLTALGIEDMSSESTKWRRLNHIFLHYQRRDGAESKLIDYVRSVLNPAGFVDDSDFF